VNRGGPEQQSMESRIIDGVRFVFQLAGTWKPPNELVVYLPQFFGGDAQVIDRST
jgi:alkyl sulfatase BDS1-like metallo-beta-lactamase superfamily hydrolase